ncbi:Gldg family protein [Thermococcus peptonophilus]|uniref:Gldg family protein n=1 Tax=Thermococcus peptonophilus TaxID=53952 RepID=UPI000AAC856D
MNDEIVVNVTRELQSEEEYTHMFYYTPPRKAGTLKVEVNLYDDTNSLLDSLIYEFVVNPNPNSVAFGLLIRYSNEYQKDLSDLNGLYANFTEVVTKLRDYGVNFDPKLAKKIEQINENYEIVNEEYTLYNTFLSSAGTSGFYLSPMIHIRKALFLGWEVKEQILEILPTLEAALEKIEEEMAQPAPSPAPENETATNQTEVPVNQTTPPAPSTNVTTNITISIPSVLIDASHNQYYVNKVGVNSLIDKIKSELNWDVEISYEPLTYDRIKDYDVVVILNPANDLTDEEISALREYVEEGGGLIVAGDWYKYVNPSLNKLLEGYGITFEITELMDDDHNSGRPYYPYVGVYNRNIPITKFIPDGHEMYYNGNTLRVSGDAVWVIRAFETSYAVDADGNVVHEKGSQPIVAAAVEVGKGRIVAYGSSKGFSDSYGGRYIESTWPFIKGALLWLAGEI